MRRYTSSTCWAEWQVTVPPLIVLRGMQGEHLAPVTAHAAARRILELRLHPFGCMAYHPRERLVISPEAPPTLVEDPWVSRHANSYVSDEPSKSVCLGGFVVNCALVLDPNFSIPWPSF
jgi:hypothetical protein